MNECNCCTRWSSAKALHLIAEPPDAQVSAENLELPNFTLVLHGGMQHFAPHQTNSGKYSVLRSEGLARFEPNLFFLHQFLTVSKCWGGNLRVFTGYSGVKRYNWVSAVLGSHGVGLGEVIQKLLGWDLWFGLQLQEPGLNPVTWENVRKRIRLSPCWFSEIHVGRRKNTRFCYCTLSQQIVLIFLWSRFLICSTPQGWHECTGDISSCGNKWFCVDLKWAGRG